MVVIKVQRYIKSILKFLFGSWNFTKFLFGSFTLQGKSEVGSTRALEVGTSRKSGIPSFLNIFVIKPLFFWFFEF